MGRTVRGKSVKTTRTSAHGSPASTERASTARSVWSRLFGAKADSRQPARPHPLPHAVVLARADGAARSWLADATPQVRDAVAAELSALPPIMPARKFPVTPAFI